MTQKRATPTVKRRRVGSQLRQWRELVPLKSGDAAKLMKWDGTRLSRIERGLYRVSAEEVATLARTYGMGDEAAVREVARAAQEPLDVGWWTPYRDVLAPEYLDFIVLESEALAVRAWHPTLITGILQSPAYAREMIGASVAPMSLQRAERLVAARMARQEVLTRAVRNVDYKALVPESAFHQRFVGGDAVMRDQMRRLLDLTRLPHVEVRVVPLDALPHSGLTTNFTLLTFGHPWTAVCSVDHTGGGSLIEKPDDVAPFSAMFDQIANVALSAEDSRELIVGKYTEGILQ